MQGKDVPTMDLTLPLPQPPTHTPWLELYTAPGKIIFTAQMTNIMLLETHE
jgi:hypothetical protein